ncbi:hypothetical protein HNR55_001399 [Acetobacter lovaniensis]|uniref:Uncharacterized protein n=1 Tax=Acetobacter lovaniensis TaxID=104100 RepID=A0A841QED3_9PROT|nr:hypothetical protein [Acetobacter lovaniensis]
MTLDAVNNNFVFYKSRIAINKNTMRLFRGMTRYKSALYHVEVKHGAPRQRIKPVQSQEPHMRNPCTSLKPLNYHNYSKILTLKCFHDALKAY